MASVSTEPSTCHEDRAAAFTSDGRCLDAADLGGLDEAVEKGGRLGAPCGF